MVDTNEWKKAEALWLVVQALVQAYWLEFKIEFLNFWFFSCSNMR